eukprot:CFRG6189T1
MDDLSAFGSFVNIIETLNLENIESLPLNHSEQVALSWIFFDSWNEARRKSWLQVLANEHAESPQIADSPSISELVSRISLMQFNGNQPNDEQTELSTYSTQSAKFIRWFRQWSQGTRNEYFTGIRAIDERLVATCML